MSCADFAFILYRYYLAFDPNDPNWFNRDRFILSGGHMSMVQYALITFLRLVETHDIKKFRQLHSNTPGHPEVEVTGVECTTGPLGQGFAWLQEWRMEKLIYVISFLEFYQGIQTS